MALRARTVSAIVILIALSTSILVYRQSDRYQTFMTDAKSAFRWYNPLCSDLSALRGLMKARTVQRRSDEIRAASRLVREDPEGLFLYETPVGQFWMPQENDLKSLAVILAEQELDMYGRPGELGVRKGDVVIDAGAHVGLFTRSALAAGASKVITFEVTPKSNQALRRNLAREIADGRVVVVEKGVWFEEATMPLVIVEGCSACNSVSHPEMAATMNVPLTTIDRVVDDLDLEGVDFIKLDVENAEANALRGARKTIASYFPRVAVALENSKARIAYGHEVMGLMQEVYAGYQYACGSVTYTEPSPRILPEVLHFYPE